MIKECNLDNLFGRLAKDETDPAFAIFDMMSTGAIYQHQGTLEYYIIQASTGNVYQLNRYNNIWGKTILTFKFMASSKWKKVEDG